MSPKFNFIIPADLLARIRAVAEEKGVPIATIVNQLISDYVNNVDRVSLKDLDDRITALEEEMSRLKGMLERK